MSYIKAQQDKDRARQLAKANADTKEQQKAARAKHRADKDRVKPKSKRLADLQAIVNKYVRLRDAHLGCVSCDKPASWGGQWHASHYYSRGHSSALRFNLWNIHKSCSVCNSHLSGNIEKYTPAIIEKIGQDKYEWLARHKSDVRTYDVEWIKRAIKIFNKKARSVKKRRSR
jgi:hypothetical protein